MSWSISLLSSFICGSVLFASLSWLRWSIFILMSSGRSLFLFLILPFGMLCLSAANIRLVMVLFAICMFVGGATLESAFSISS